MKIVLHFLFPTRIFVFIIWNMFTFLTKLDRNIADYYVLVQQKEERLKKEEEGRLKKEEERLKKEEEEGLQKEKERLK